MTTSIALVDCDIITYRCGFASEKKRYIVGEHEFGTKREMDSWLAINPGRHSIRVEKGVQPVEFALHNVDTVLQAIRRKLDCEIECHLSGDGNFRYSLATIKEYKANRRDVAKPVHYAAIRDFIGSKYSAKFSAGEEADDAIGIRACALGQSAIIVSTDKDLNTIPGPKYNWVRDELYDVSEEQSYRNFYHQVLTGDATDNVPGIEGVGNVTARRILKGLRSPKAMWQTVLGEYLKHYPESYFGLPTKQAVIEICRLLYIRRKPEEIWSPP